MTKFISTTNCFVIKENKVLLLHRDKSLANFPDFYMGPGGKQEVYESVQDAAIREVQEETGLEIKNTRLRLIATHHYPHMDKVYLVFLFLADYVSGEPTNEKDGQLEWVEKAKATKLKKLYPDLKTYFPIIFKDTPVVTFSHIEWDKNFKPVKINLAQ